MATAAGSPSIESIAAFLGPFPSRVELDVEEMEQVDCGSYIRWKVRYSVAPGERVAAFVCVPKEAETPGPAVFCHHQHAGKFALGKSEVVGLAGDPDQAYASELAEQGFITIAPDAVGFEERNWSPDQSENISWFELSTRLRIRASVSNCGCIAYRLSFMHDTGMQAEFVVPGFAQHHDVDDVIACFQDSALLISATTEDKWSRGAQDVFANARHVLGDNVELAIYDGRHVFTPLMRERAYQFLKRRLSAPTSVRPVRRSL
jgi:hypothetical protein